ncbi:MAG: DUF305 domain-containing protein [Candidatus Mariimomonas ferrooxydans]
MRSVKKFLLIPVITMFIFAGTSAAEQKTHNMSGSDMTKMKHAPASPAMVHMNHADIINSEKDFLREMIPHHQEAVDTSVLLFVSTKDSELKKLTESIYKAQTREILDMRLSYAQWYNLIPTGAMYQPMMRDLNGVTGMERDTRYVQDMIMHHKGAVDMADKVLTIEEIHDETIKFAKDIIKNQKAEIEFMENWLKKAGAGK